MELYTDEGAKEKTSPLWFSTAAIQLSNSIFEAAYNLSFYPQPRWTCSLFSLSAHLGFFKVTLASILKVFKIKHQYSFWTRQGLLILRKYNKTRFRYSWKSALSGSFPAWRTVHFWKREGWEGGAPVYLVFNLVRPLSWLFVSLSLTAWSITASDGHRGTLRGSWACITVDERGWMLELLLLIRFSESCKCMCLTCHLYQENSGIHYMETENEFADMQNIETHTQKKYWHNPYVHPVTGISVSFLMVYEEEHWLIKTHVESHDWLSISILFFTPTYYSVSLQWPIIHITSIFFIDL